MPKIILSFLLFVNVIAFSQNQLSPVSWSVSYEDLPNDEGMITFTAKIDPHWHIYSQRPTDAGPIPTSFTITPGTGFEFIGKVEEKDAHEEYVAAFEAKVFVFEKEAVFKQKIKRVGAGKTKTEGGYKYRFPINSQVEYMTCNDKQCLPPKIIDLMVTVPGKLLGIK